MVDKSDPEAEASIDEIRAAFADVPRGPLSLHQAMSVKYVTEDELEEAARLDKDRHWSQIPDDDLETGGRALYGADRRSWHYLVPAFMVWSLRYFRVNSSFVSDQTIYTFDLSKDEGLRQEALKRFAVLSAPQCQAVCRFLRYMARHGSHADDAVARRALDAYWGRFCEGQSP